MTSQLNYLVAQQRHIEIAYRAEQGRLAGEARAAESAPARRRDPRRLRTSKWLRGSDAAAAVGKATAASLHGELRCDT